MQLKSLEIIGFKSFADRTKLDFSGGITSVVGPNGSGKSNIADAVRWVLGEQSTKTLRGQKMEDIIFGGTQTRKATGFSSVSLTVDNKARKLSVDADEVTISRKLYRSGDSEYRINNVAVRLKDVNEILMDTGLGRDGYSIIGQGKIAEIVSAKSAQRREIFEEAAGISKYRYRKGEAQKKLDAAQENLLRLKDIMLEIEDRIEPLRQQSQKAAEFLEYAEEKKVLEVSLWMATIEQSKEVLEEQEQKLLICKNSHDDVQAILEDMERRIQQLFEKVQSCAVELEQKRTEISQNEAKLAQCDSMVAVYNNDIFHNQNTISRLKEDLQSSEKSLLEGEQDVKNQEEKMAALSLLAQELKEAFEETARKLSALKEENRKESTDLSALKARKTTYEQDIANQQLLKASSSTLLTETSSRLDAIQENQALKDENIQLAQKELADCEALIKEVEEEITSAENTSRGLTMMAQSKQNKLDELLQKQKELEDTAQGHIQRAKLLMDMEKNMEGFAASVKYIMKQAKGGLLKGIHGPISTLLSTQSKLTVAIETALGAATQNVVVDDEYAAKTAINHLKNAKEGRATFLPLTSIKGKTLSENGLEQCEGFIGVASNLVTCASQYQQIALNLLGRTVVAQDIDCAVVMAKKYGYRFRIVTLDGQLVNAGGSLTGGYLARTAGIMSRQTEIDSLNEKAEKLRLQVEELLPTIKEVREELSGIDAKMTACAARLQTAKEDRIHALAEQKRFHMQLEEAKQAFLAAKEEQKRTLEKLEQLRLQGSSSDEILEKVSALLVEVEKEIATAETASASRFTEENTLTEKQNADAIRLLTVEKDKEALEQSIQHLRSLLSSHSSQSSQLQDRVAELERTNQTITQQIEAQEAEKVTIQLEITQIKTAMAEIMQTRESYEQETTQLRRDEKEHIATREKLAADLGRLEEKKLALQGEFDSIISRLYDEYNLTRSGAAEIVIVIEDKVKAQRRLSELKNKIKALGSVNVAAIEEYKEIAQRYTFMKEQIDDIEKSKSQLYKLIADLTAEMKQIFETSFSQINHHFGQIFVELFGGGKAELTLTDPADILESGIEINVQPPGKIIKNLSALSGGEQAFVAIAIYFAILKVRPAPFCLLDEIEAALDEVNVSKYAAYLRKMCHNTQFIAITHRRGTMEEADVLYGVTMQEEGVSKLLELNVSQVEMKLGIKS